MAKRNLLPRTVLPVVATFTVAYPAMFMFGLWSEDEAPMQKAKGRTIAEGSMSGGWKYDVSARAFPTRSYRLDILADKPGAQPLCVVEVAGGPKPQRAIAGQGSVVHVTFEKPLQGHVTRSISVDLTDGLDQPCAALVDNGVRLPPQAGAGSNWLTVMRGGRAERGG